MTTVREALAALNGIKEDTKQNLTEGTADTVRYITKTKELFNDMEESEEAQLDEKWNTEMHTAEKDKGMFKGKTQEELKAQRSKKHTAAETKKLKQLDFALRAKNKFGKIKESLESLGNGATIIGAIKELESLEADVISECVDYSDVE